MSGWSRATTNGRCGVDLVPDQDFVRPVVPYPAGTARNSLPVVEVFDIRAPGDIAHI